MSCEDGTKAPLTKKGAESVLSLERFAILASYAGGGEEVRVAACRARPRPSPPSPPRRPQPIQPAWPSRGRGALLTWRRRGGHGGHGEPLQRLSQHGGGAAQIEPAEPAGRGRPG